MSTGGTEVADHVVVRVSLLESDPPIWRQLSAVGDLTLDRVHEVFQAAFGWEDLHLHRFTAKDPYERVSGDELEQGWPPQWVPSEFVEEEHDRAEEQTTLLQLLEAGGGRAYYEYDFGDSWLHLIEAVGRKPAGPVSVRMIAGENACPPEDCGGIHSYLDFMDTLDDPADPQHAEAAELARGIGDGFDPRGFDQAAAQADLADVQKQWSRRSA